MNSETPIWGGMLISYGTCNSILYVLKCFCLWKLLSQINPPYVSSNFDWQVVFILTHTEDFPHRLTFSEPRYYRMVFGVQ